MIILETSQCRRLRLTDESESRLDSDISVKKEVTVNNYIAYHDCSKRNKR
jgi:hypothetical protein